MARAGIVEGHRHVVCRKQGCRYEERADDHEERTRARVRLWPKALVQAVTRSLGKSSSGQQRQSIEAGFLRLFRATFLASDTLGSP